MTPPRAFDLGDVAIVSGAGSRLPVEIGTGRATAVLLARHGAKIALLDNNLEWALETKRRIEAESGISASIKTDVTEEDSCKMAVAKTGNLFGAVHFLVNVVGVGGVVGDATKLDLAGWERSWLCKEARCIRGLIMPVDAGTTARRPDRRALAKDTLAVNISNEKV